MKGGRKRRKSHFKKGNRTGLIGLESRRWSTFDTQMKEYKRVDEDKYEMAVSSGNYGPGAAPQQSTSNISLLRPTPRPPTLIEQYQHPDTPDPDRHTYRIVNPQKTAEMFNKAMKDHKTHDFSCTGDLIWDHMGEVQWGLAWKVKLTCIQCHFTSELCKLYDEVETDKPGPNPATINYGVHVGLSHTSIGSTETCNLLLSMNIPSPAVSGLQKNANIVGQKLIQHNEKSMTDIRDTLQEVNMLRGLPASAPVPVQTDSRYNNPAGSGNTPQQAATQCTTVTCENSTKKHKIIGLHCVNKLCQSGSLIASRTGKLPCPDHPGCTATLSSDAVIGNEKQWAKQTYSQLAEHGFYVGEITTDPDSSSYRAGAELFSENILPQMPTHYLDTRHVQNGQRRHILKQNFSASMFPGTTAIERSKMQKRFASDLSSRCDSEHKAAFLHFNGDTDKTLSKLTYTSEAVLQCYKGDHSLCKKHSFVCRGKEKNNWLIKSVYLTAKLCKNDSQFKITCDPSDNEKLIECINYRLGIKMLRKTKHLSNTQKCEATNKAFSNSVPKNKSLSRNFEPRIQSTVNGVNLGIAESTTSQCEAVGCPITKGSKVARGLARRQAAYMRSRAHHASAKAKRNRITRTKRRYLNYDKLHAEPVQYYKKNMVVKRLFNSSDCPALADHTYA